MDFNSEKFRQLILNGKTDIDFLYFDEIDSTNTFAKGANFNKTTLVVASSQTNGRGRLGRKFVSEKNKGVYFSLVKKGLAFEQIRLLSIAAAVCVCEALEKYSCAQFKVKWVNDILLDKKKICGILVENVVGNETGFVERSVIGVGIDLYGKIDSELKSIASTVEEMTGDILPCENVLYDVVCGLERFFACDDQKEYLEKYKKRCVTVGRTVTVDNFSEKYTAKALGIDESGLLIIEKNGKRSVLNSGEVSVTPIFETGE